MNSVALFDINSKTNKQYVVCYLCQRGQLSSPKSHQKNNSHRFWGCHAHSVWFFNVFLFSRYPALTVLLVVTCFNENWLWITQGKILLLRFRNVILLCLELVAEVYFFVIWMNRQTLKLWSNQNLSWGFFLQKCILSKDWIDRWIYI